MENIKTHLDLNLSSSSNYTVINTQQYDHNTRELEINLYHNGVIYDLTNITNIVLAGERGDGIPIRDDHLEHIENTIYYTIPSALLAAEGLCQLKIMLYQDERLLSSFPFSIRVSENVYHEDKLMESPQYSILQTEINKLQNLNIETEESPDSYIIKITDKEGGSSFSPNLLNKISIGTVETCPYTEKATATIIGEFGKQKLNLRIPVGATPHFSIGTVTTGAEGSQATATISGTYENPVLNLVIPKGDTGTVNNVCAATIPYASESDTNMIKDIVDGKLDANANAVSATKATQDNRGNTIDSTYIKGLSVSGKTITYTKGNGTTGTITTQDTNTTYSTGTASTPGLTKLYTSTGTGADGTMTRTAITNALGSYLPMSGGTVSGNLTVGQQLTVGGALNATGNVINFPTGATISSHSKYGNDFSIRGLTLYGIPSLAPNPDRAFLQISTCKYALLGGVEGRGSGTEYNASLDIGTRGYPFGTIYIRQSPIIISDRNQKHNIQKISNQKYENLFDSLDMCTYVLNDNSHISPSTSPNVRNHIGLIAQDVEDKVEKAGLTSNEFAGVCSEFFCDSARPWRAVCGGFRREKEGYAYSENTYNFKHDLDYEFYNEIIEKKLSDLNLEDYRKNIGYLMIQDNSKLTKKQPPLIINSISLKKKDGTLVSVPLDNETISYYKREDKTFSNPLSSSHINENGSLVVSFDRWYTSLFLKLSDSPFNVDDYESILFDVDFVSEYKLILIPDGTYQNANVWDRAHNDKILYDYSFRYDELYGLTTHVLKKTRQEFREYKAETEKLLSEMKMELNNLKQNADHAEVRS